MPEERIREAVPAREPKALAYTHTRYATFFLSEAATLGFLGVMRRLSQQNLSDPAPPPLVEALLHDHPSIRNRIVMALEYEAEGQSRDVTPQGRSPAALDGSDGSIRSVRSVR